jgi:predicted kinase
VSATVWIVAGPPGAGKSTVARLLAPRLDPPGAVLDKDTMYGGFVAATLSGAGRPSGEREGPWYDTHVKRHEYAGLAATAREIRAAGCPPILVAPFTDALRDPSAWKDLVDACGGEPARLIWLDIDEKTLATRLRARASSRDTAKLTSLDAFLRRMRPGVPPVVPHSAIRTTPDAPDLPTQLAGVLHP